MFASAPTKVDQDDPDEADDSDDEYGDALLQCYLALAPPKVVLSNENALKSNENQKMTNMPWQARRLGGQPSSIRSPFLETAR